MASLIILKGKTNDLDLTRFIKVPNYKVQEVRNFTSWIDGNYNERRRITDTKVKGVFSLFFMAKEDYFNFVDFIAENEDKNDGSISCVVYCNNRNTTKRVNAFLDFEPQNELPKIENGFEVSITERGDLW